MSSLRVVYLDHVAQLSGAELALTRLLPGLPDIEPLVILGEDGELVSVLQAQGVSVEIFALGEAGQVRKESLSGVSGWLGQVGQIARYVRALAGRIQILRPDLVHTNSLKAGYYGCLAARLAGVPVVWHLHDRLADDYLPAKAAAATRMTIRLLADGLICNSLSTMETTRAAATTIPSAVIPNAVAPGQIGAGLRATEHSSHLTVVMVGRLAPWKGQDSFLRAFAAASAGTTSRARLVGSAMFGEDAYAQGLRALVRELRIEDRVEFAGFVSDVAAELATADVLVHASRIPEPFGQVVIEGMAAGLPVLAPAAGGPGELVTSEVNGLLFAPNDVDDLAAKLRSLLFDADLRRRLGAAGLTHAAGFGTELIGERVMQLYRTVLAR